MAVRRRRLYPDATLPTVEYGQIDFITDQAFVAAVAAAAETVTLAGGVLTVLVERHPTDMQHEMVTTGAVIEWKDRTDARPQAEPVTPLQEPVREPEEAIVATFGEPLAPETEPVQDDVGDGLDTAQLEDEDLESIPAAAR